MNIDLKDPAGHGNVVDHDEIYERDCVERRGRAVGHFRHGTIEASTGYQMLVDHRKSGGIGGFYGNGFGRSEGKVTSHDLLA